MRNIRPLEINERNLEIEPKPVRDFIVNKIFAFGVLDERFFLNLKIGRDLRAEPRQRPLSARKKRFNNAMILIFCFLLLYVTVASLVFAAYTLKSLAGIDTFPDLHFFH